MKQINFSKKIKHAILADKHEIERLCTFLSEKYDSMKFRAECIDGTTMTTDDLGEILDYDNSDRRRIQNLQISALTSRSEKIDVWFRTDRYSSPADIDLDTSSDERAVVISNKVISIIQEMKPRYDLLARIRISSVFLIATLFGSFVFGLTKVANLTFPGPNDAVGFYGFMAMMVLSASVLISPSIYGGDDFLFPRVLFIWGKQERRVERLSKRRFFVFSTVILSILLGVAANFIYSFLSQKPN